MYTMYARNAPAIHFATFLAPSIYHTYEYIARYIGEKVGYPTTLIAGQSFEELTGGQVDVAFICGLPYVQLADAPDSNIELLGAPVLLGERYRHRSVYFSDVIVRNSSPYTSFDDLAGCVWAYNQPGSHSGYNLVCYSLLEWGKTPHYFGSMVEAGSHQRSLQMVLKGQADATAIDSHVLEVLLLQDRELGSQLRVVASLGPSSIPPVVVAKNLDSDLKYRMREALITMHCDPDAARSLQEGRIERFAPVSDADYDDIRKIAARVRDAMKAPF
ncbi:MAG: PhnD/SsuA/transferrin family substrate-binding protein [Ktedonobacteraceae bacterium]